ncbi:MAG TPA: SH3-like domain-containing protein [Stellaceae bacterium]|nr:SH3-like domain-containing protein [Stellaceae bacterium]
MPVLTAAMVPLLVTKGRSARRDDAVPARFKPGDQIVAKVMSPLTHTRLPRYVRGRRGVIERDHGVFVFPDTNALFAGPHPQHVYNVRFSARELWGPEGAATDAIYIDLWDSYLDRA